MTVFDWEKTKKEIKDLETETQKDGFWNDHEKAGKVSKKLEGLRKELKEWEELKGDFKNVKEYLEDLIGLEVEFDEELGSEIKVIEKGLGTFERKTFFSGRYDQNDAILEIHAGAGGDDAQDWAEMLLRMYLRFCEKRNWKTEILNKSEGGEAGIKSVVVEIQGEMVFGNLKNEKGVHRLVRQSPFNADALRQTSFAAVSIWPILEKEDEIEIASSDLKIDTFRSSGAGGQSVNTTDSAVRITHLPTGTVVSCQNERSQIKNKEAALKVLKAKLYEYFEIQRKEKEKEIKGENKSVEWGNQIRSYVFHPYKMVKDHRTGFEASDVEGVMNGEIGEFIESCLKDNCAISKKDVK